MLLIPGWATDYRIFDTLKINYNYLLPVEFSPFNFCDDLLAAMKDNDIKKISVLGWSMGGFVACDLMSKCRDRVNEIIFVGIRRRYEKVNIDKIKTFLVRNKKTFLHKFYNDCILLNVVGSASMRAAKVFDSGKKVTKIHQNVPLRKSSIVCLRSICWLDTMLEVKEVNLQKTGRC
jgi:pimeloyl-ACP methyl ester carboxylesterase